MFSKKKRKLTQGKSILRRSSEALRLHFKSIFTVLLLLFVVWMAIGAGKLTGLMEAHKIAPNATTSYSGFIAAVTANHHLHGGKVFIENDGMAIFQGPIKNLDKKWEITNFSSNINKSGLLLLTAHHVPIKGSVAIGLTPYRPVAQAAVAGNLPKKCSNALQKYLFARRYSWARRGCAVHGRLRRIILRKSLYILLIQGLRDRPHVNLRILIRTRVLLELLKLPCEILHLLTVQARNNRIDGVLSGLPVADHARLLDRLGCLRQGRTRTQ
jgi:hypothetical protein